eukprot:m.128884 g.128884  ORF g.128884 m.128884 type:complete len:432 (+) comp29359_c1_seq2:252-1547(+)
MAGHVRLTYKLNKFFFSELRALRTQIPDAKDVEAKVASGKSFTITVLKAYPKKYNADLSQLRDDTLQSVSRSAIPVGTAIVLFFIIRCLCMLSAVTASNPPLTTFCISLVQFLLLPCSFAVSFQHFLVLFFPLLGPHYVAMVFLYYIVPTWCTLTLTITPALIAALVIADQCMCWMFMLETPKGKSISFDTWTTMKHVVYGFFNCKTYSLILLLLLLGFKINVTVWLIDSCFGVTRRISDLVAKHIMDWATVYYHQHRIAHLPIVYDQAHKFHHYLHDTTPFDAHIYGAGAPEEWFCLVVEASLALYCGYCPALLNYDLMMQSISSKIGHTRSEKSFGGVNHHADHHTLHRKNFGFGSNIIVDMLFGTNSDNDRYDLGPYIVTKVQSETCVYFNFDLQSNNEEDLTKMLGEYYNPSLIRCFQVVLTRFAKR